MVAETEVTGSVPSNTLSDYVLLKIIGRRE